MSVLEPSDQELVICAQAGDTHAFDLLVSRHRKFVRYMVARHVWNVADIEDAMQEVFLKAWRFLKHYQELRSSFRIWLGRIAMQRGIDFSKREGRQCQTKLCLQQEYALRSSPHHPVLSLAVFQILSRLPTEEVITYLLVDYCGYTYDETATALNMSSTGIAKRLMRIRRVLDLIPESHAVRGRPKNILH